MAASGNNRFGLTRAQVQTPVPVPVATGPVGDWNTGATTLSLFPVGTGTGRQSQGPDADGRIAGTDDTDHNEDAWPWKKRDSAGAGNNPAEDVPDDASWLRL
ncbi:unnamed protein product [Miscanthus lutarioriparius]|uniref:Uncharacterized protein n=1 Tax=Miscanthus lutarioriparius TaxID=422564 RepID=A0A811MCU9_9POAL|nr:unnamed protein product [Miscanthus lutarioriparius]